MNDSNGVFRLNLRGRLQDQAIARGPVTKLPFY